jgi:hypothetical protein
MPLSGVFWITRFPASTSIDDLEPSFQQCVRKFLAAISSARAGLPNADVVNARPAAPNGAARAHDLAGARAHDLAGARAHDLAGAGRAGAGLHNTHAHPHYKINSTLRPAQRAYLMHYCWLISRSKINPADVPAYQPVGNQRDPVDIEWVHRDAKGNPDVTASWRAANEMVNGFRMAGLRVAPALDSNHVRGKAIDMDISWHGNLDILNASGNTIHIATLPRDGTNRHLIEVGATYGVYHLRNVDADRPHWSYDGR